MIIEYGRNGDESVVFWKYAEDDKWNEADIDELIHVYEDYSKYKRVMLGEKDDGK